MPGNLAAAQAVIFTALLFAASVCDLRKREIPDLLNGAIALTALLSFSPWNLLGVLTGLPFLLAAITCGGMGGGDVKLMAASGLVLGLPGGIAATVLGLTAILPVCGTLTLIHRLHGQREKIPFPLGPFLAAGCLAAYFMKIGGLIL